jgi:hypothetical protein
LGLAIASVRLSEDAELTVADPEPPGPLVLTRAADDVTAPLPVDDGVTVSDVDDVVPGATVRLWSA